MTMSLKFQNRPLLAIVLIVNVVIWYVLTVTGRADFAAVLDLAKNWQMLLPVGIGMLLVGILCEQFGAITKARLVFWRWSDPLPGSRAFSELGFGDPRVDMTAVTAKLGGALPSDSAEQNRVWYRLYKEVQDQPAVAGVHREYLLLRDYACLAVLMLVLLPVLAVWLGLDARLAGFYVLCLLLQYLLVRRAASQAGCRFVVNVLAVSA